MSAEALLRISHVLGIGKALHVQFPHPQQVATWLRRPNQAPLFSGRPALAILLESGIDGLTRARGNLDAPLL